MGLRHLLEEAFLANIPFQIPHGAVRKAVTKLRRTDCPTRDELSAHYWNCRPGNRLRTSVGVLKRSHLRCIATRFILEWVFKVILRESNLPTTGQFYPYMIIVIANQ